MSREVQCFHCKYVWESRVTKPKSCPRCKQRLDIKPKSGKNFNFTGSWNKKMDAKSSTDRARDKGKKARVVKNQGTNQYDVFTRG